MAEVVSGSIAQPVRSTEPAPATTLSNSPNGVWFTAPVEPNQSVNFPQKFRLPYAEQESPAA